jgi:hypothetical protein
MRATAPGALRCTKALRCKPVNTGSRWPTQGDGDRVPCRAGARGSTGGRTCGHQCSRGICYGSEGQNPTPHIGRRALDPRSRYRAKTLQQWRSHLAFLQVVRVGCLPTVHIRKPLLYPLSYEGLRPGIRASAREYRRGLLVPSGLPVGFRRWSEDVRSKFRAHAARRARRCPALMSGAIHSPNTSGALAATSELGKHLRRTT